jgi:branched-chain amino acid transport system substrate-binding protein
LPQTTSRTLLALPAALAAPAALAQANETRLGALFPLSGNLALLGDESFRGLELAAEERNAAGGLLGRPIRLVKADAADASQAVAEARRLMGAEKVGAIFGSYGSQLALPASQVVELQGMTYLELGAISDALTERGFRGLFRTCPRASDFGRLSVAAVTEVLAPLWQGEPAGIGIAILHEEGLYGQTVAGFQEAELKAQNLRQVEKLAYAPRAADLSAMVQRLRGAGAQLVLHTGFQNDILLFFRAMQEARWLPRMVVGAGAGYSLAETARNIGPAFDGTLNVDFPQFEVNERAAPGARRFVEDYRRRYGSEPRSGHSLAAYVGARACLEAMQRAGGLDRDRLRPALLATDIAEGATANGWGIRFDEKGQNTRAQPALLQWQGGRLLTVGPQGAAVAPVKGRLGA